MQKSYNVNSKIKAIEVDLILFDGTMQKAVPLFMALKMAEEKGLDVVEVSGKRNGKLSVCKILNYGKMIYQNDKKQKTNKQGPLPSGIPANLFVVEENT